MFDSGFWGLLPQSVSQSLVPPEPPKEAPLGLEADGEGDRRAAGEMKMEKGLRGTIVAGKPAEELEPAE